MNITIIIILLIGLVISAMVCMIIPDLLKASIMMAAVSCVLAIIMFLMDAHIAAMLELSVCAGLITVIFISTISMTRVYSKEEQAERKKARDKRFIFLPVLLVILSAVMLLVFLPRLDMIIPHAVEPPNAITEPDVFWNERQMDLVGQIIIVLSGVFGILIFFKEQEKK